MARVGNICKGDVVRVKNTGQVRVVNEVWVTTDGSNRTRVELADGQSAAHVVINATEVTVIKTSTDTSWVTRSWFTRVLALIGFLVVFVGAASISYYLYRLGVPGWMALTFGVMSWQSIDLMYSGVIRALDGRPIR